MAAPIDLIAWTEAVRADMDTPDSFEPPPRDQAHDAVTQLDQIFHLCYQAAAMLARELDAAELCVLRGNAVQLVKEARTLARQLSTTGAKFANERDRIRRRV